jgi:hypothetical protein
MQYFMEVSPPAVLGGICTNLRRDERDCPKVKKIVFTTPLARTGLFASTKGEK